MNLNELTRHNSGLRLIDHQPWIAFPIRPIPPEPLTSNVMAAANVAAALDMPAILSTISGTGGPLRDPPFASVQRVFPDIEPMDRHVTNAWMDEAVVAAVIASERRKLVMAGLRTEVRLAQSAPSAMTDGYVAHFVADASSGLFLEAHQQACKRIIQAGARPTTRFAMLVEGCPKGREPGRPARPSHHARAWRRRRLGRAVRHGHPAQAGTTGSGTSPMILKGQRLMSHALRFATGSLAVLLAAPALAQAKLEPPSGFERVEFIGNEEALVCMTGGEGTSVVLLHGWPQTADEWVPILPGLAETHTVYACDLPGIRESTNQDDDFTKAGMAEDVHAALTSAIQGPVHLIGHDIGLMVAYAYASAFPDDVASLTVMDAPLPGTPAYAQLATDPRAWHFAFHMAPEVPERIVANDVEFYVTHFIESLWMSEERPTAEEMAPYVEAYSEPDTLRAGFEFYRSFPEDAESNASEVTSPLPMPVLALNGGLIPQPWMLEMMRPLATDVRGGVIEGSGHWISEEQPEALLAEIASFLDEVEQ